MSDVTRGAFAKRLCNALELKASQRRLNAIVAWETAEGTKAKFNPLATTRQMPGATNFNSTGVKNYVSLKDGVSATVKTLRESGHGYERIVSRLEDNDSARSVLEGVRDSAWGTGGLALQILPDVKADFDHFASQLIGQ